MTTALFRTSQETHQDYQPAGTAVWRRQAANEGNTTVPERGSLSQAGVRHADQGLGKLARGEDDN